MFSASLLLPSFCFSFSESKKTLSRWAAIAPASTSGGAVRALLTGVLLKAARWILNSSARLMSPGVGSVGAGDGRGVADGDRAAAQPFFFSVAQAPHEDRYAPARVEAACMFACAFDESRAPGGRGVTGVAG